MKLSLTFIGILLLGLYFELWGTSPIQMKDSDYSHVELTLDEHLAATAAARKKKYLESNGYIKSYFPLAPYVKMGPDTYMWMAFERVILMWLTGVIIWISCTLKQYSRTNELAVLYPAVGYLFLQIGDFIDWAITYNTEYYHFTMIGFEVPISYNTISFLTFVIFVVYQWSNGSSAMRIGSFSGFRGGSNGHY